MPGSEPALQPSPQSARPGRATDELRYLILAVQREGSRRLAARLRDAGLTPAQAEVLDVLSDRAPLSLAELGRLLICETGSPSRLVDVLVQRGLVTRTPSPHDRRVVSLGLTEAGREAQAASAGSATVREAISSRLTGPEIGQLSGLLRRLIEDTPGGAAIAARFPHGGPLNPAGPDGTRTGPPFAGPPPASDSAGGDGAGRCRLDEPDACS